MGISIKRVIVNKMIMGPRIYTDLHFSPEGQELKAVRLGGLRGLRRNDIVVFNFPLHGDSISFASRTFSRHGIVSKLSLLVA